MRAKAKTQAHKRHYSKTYNPTQVCLKRKFPIEFCMANLITPKDPGEVIPPERAGEIITPQGRGELVYCATPSRLTSKAQEIADYVSKRGYSPLQPLIKYPRKDYEDNPQIGREQTMQYCLADVEQCKEFWLFGISKGTVRELKEAIELQKAIRLITQFDGGWNMVAAELRVTDLLETLVTA